MWGLGDSTYALYAPHIHALRSKIARTRAYPSFLGKLTRPFHALRYLMNIMFAARYFDWAFLLALLLLDEPGAARILEEVALDPETTGV